MRLALRQGVEAHGHRFLLLAAFDDLRAAPGRFQGLPAGSIGEDFDDLRHERQFRRNLARHVVARIGEAHGEPQAVLGRDVLRPGPGLLPGLRKGIGNSRQYACRDGRLFEPGGVRLDRLLQAAERAVYDEREDRYSGDSNPNPDAFEFRHVDLSVLIEMERPAPRWTVEALFPGRAFAQGHWEPARGAPLGGTATANAY